MAEKVDVTELAGQTAEFYLELKRKGVAAEEAARLAKEIGHAASSSSHGHCRSPLEPEFVSRPPLTKRGKK